MHLTKLNINNVGGIDSLSLKFSRKMNLICGPNGIGKTTILECIAQMYAGEKNLILKKRVNSERGGVTGFTAADAKDGEVVAETKHQYNVSFFVPTEGDYSAGKGELSKYLLSLKVARTFSYKSLVSVSKDAEKAAHTISNENKNGVNLDEVKNWFVNRYLYSPHKGALTPAQKHNFNISKSFFGILNSDYSFSRVDAASNEIMVNTPAGEIYYEYLSSGFKSCLSILFGIVKELEFRFRNPGLKVDQFDGVILIDEVELHLHPEWQARICNILKEAFPKAQYIVTTHSPHVIQSAQPEEVIALEPRGDSIVRRELPSTKYGFQGWTVEEVLIDIMGMHDTRTNVYAATLNDFEQAVDREDFIAASESYNKLDELLHPENHLRKLLAFQLGALRE